MQLRPFTTGNAAAQRWNLEGAGAVWPRGRPLPVYRPGLRPMTRARVREPPGRLWRCPPATGPPVSGALQKTRRHARTVRNREACPRFTRDRNPHDTDRRHRCRHPRPAAEPLERHRPGPDRRLRRARGRISPDRRHPGGRPRCPHHPADARRDAHRPCPGPRPGFRRRRAVRPPRTRRAADLQRRPQRTRGPRRPLRGLHHRLRVRGHGGGLADRRRAPPHRGPSRQAPRGPAFRRRNGEQHHLRPRPRHPGNDGQREAGLLQGLPRRPGLLPRRCDQERTGRDHCPGAAQGVPGSADPPGPDRRDSWPRPAATALGAEADSRP